MLCKPLIGDTVICVHANSLSHNLQLRRFVTIFLEFFVNPFLSNGSYVGVMSLNSH